MRCLCPESRSRCLTNLLAEWNGKIVNQTAIAKRFDVSRTTAAAFVQELEQEGLIRLLPFLGSGRMPMLYLRHAYGPGRESFRGFCIDAIIPEIIDWAPTTRFFWWKTGNVRQIDLIADTGDDRIGFCFSESRLPWNKHWWPLQIGCRFELISRGYFLYRGDRAFIKPRIDGLPLNAFLDETEAWLKGTMQEKTAARARIDHLAAVRSADALHRVFCE